MFLRGGCRVGWAERWGGWSAVGKGKNAQNILHGNFFQLKFKKAKKELNTNSDHSWNILLNVFIDFWNFMKYFTLNQKLTKFM